jgi:hypothetical protein
MVQIRPPPPPQFPTPRNYPNVKKGKKRNPNPSPPPIHQESPSPPLEFLKPPTLFATNDVSTSTNPQVIRHFTPPFTSMLTSSPNFQEFEDAIENNEGALENLFLELNAHEDKRVQWYVTTTENFRRLATNFLELHTQQVQVRTNLEAALNSFHQLEEKTLEHFEDASNYAANIYSLHPRSSLLPSRSPILLAIWQTF